MPRDTFEVQPVEKIGFLTSEVEEVIEIIQGINQSGECIEQCVEIEGEELVWEDEISCTVELTKEQKDPYYETNYYFR